MSTADERYKKALKAMIYSRKPFSVGRIERECGIAVVGGVLRDLEWIERCEKGSMWIGPTPEDDSELLSMVDRVRQGVRDLDKARRNQKKTEMIERDYTAIKTLIERLAKGPQGFDTEAICEGMSIYGNVHEMLKEIHWVKARKGSPLEVWIGPVINSDDDLSKATRVLMSQLERQAPNEDVADREKRIDLLQKSVDNCMAEIERLTSDKRELAERVSALAEENTKLRASLSKSGAPNVRTRNEVSILWGLYRRQHN